MGSLSSCSRVTELKGITFHLQQVRKLKSPELLHTHFHGVLFNYVLKKFMLHVRHLVVAHDNIKTQKPRHNYLVMFFIRLHYLGTRFDNQTFIKIEKEDT